MPTLSQRFVSSGVRAAALSVLALSGCYRVHVRAADAGPLPDAPGLDAFDRDRCLALANPSFDTPPFDSDVGGTTALPSWTVLSGDIDILVSGGEYGVGTDGLDYIDLNGVTPATILQRVSGLQTGARYVVLFSLSGNTGMRALEISARDAMGVAASQRYVGSGPPLPTPRSAWETQTFAFVARASETEIRVESQETDPTHGALLDFFRCPEGLSP